MGQLIADIFITTKDRPELFKKSLQSFIKCTNPENYRLTIVDDGSSIDQANAYYDSNNEFHIAIPSVNSYIKHAGNFGLADSINHALSIIDCNNKWHEDKKVGNKNAIADFICYVQDDVLYSPGWLPKLAKMFMLFEKQHKLGFASGVECIEHPIKKYIGNGMILKDYIRATNMFARREYWMSMHPIPAFDPETGRLRAKPNNGIGSGVDWHFVRNHSNSVCKTGRTCLVIPGLLQHMGYKNSTWLARELPESDKDKEVIEYALKSDMIVK